MVGKEWRNFIRSQFSCHLSGKVCSIRYKRAGINSFHPSSFLSPLSPPPSFDLTRPAKYLLIVCLPLLICKIYENKHFFHFVQCNTHSTLQNTTHQKQSNIRIYYDFQCSACMGFLSVRMSTLWLLGILLVVSFCMFLLSNTDVIIFFVFFPYSILFLF